MAEDFVYVIGASESSRVKIGHSCNLNRRLGDIQRMSPVPLLLLWSHPGTYELEGVLHREFDAYRQHGEWFDFGGQDPIPLVEAKVRSCHPRLFHSSRVSALRGNSGPAVEAQIQTALLDLHLATQAADDAAADAEAKALDRARVVARIVDLCGGNQSDAARRIGIDQSRVNRLVQKVRAADLASKQVHHRDGAPRTNETGNLQLRDTPTTEGPA